jgi:hypothetical protein
MKHTVQATVENETYEFYVYDNTWLLRLFKNVGGITLNRKRVFLKRKLAVALLLNPAIIKHEAVHVRQAHYLGKKYLWTYIKQAFKAGFVKRQIPMEIEAYTLENTVTYNRI